MNIVLVGFMGAGKTTMGKRLASRLGYWFIDMDHQIEKEQGKKISDIFKDQGESAFRKMETDLLKRLGKTQNTVVSTGGGILTTPGHLELIREIGPSVYLNADVDTLFERATRTNVRPLLKTENPLETMKVLFAKRQHLYEQADITITTMKKSKRRIISEIIRSL